MQFDNLTSKDLELIEEGLRKIVHHRWGGMIAASQKRDAADQAYCNREYEQACETFQKVTGYSATSPTITKARGST